MSLLPDDRDMLCEVAVPYITTRATSEMQRATGLDQEEARRLLTRLASEAVCVDGMREPQRWRARSKVLGWDVTLHVEMEDGERDIVLGIVVHISARRKGPDRRFLRGR